MEAIATSKTDLQRLRDVDIRTVDRSQLVDLNSIEVDESRPVSERMEEFVRKIKNPYCFRVGDVAVKVVQQHILLYIMLHSMTKLR